MAIQPIDLQTLFTQMDKVAKSDSLQREGLALQQTLQGIQIQRKTEEQIKAVNEAQNMGEGAEKVKDRRARGEGGGKGKKKDRENDDNPDQSEAGESVFRDPRLGKNIDISL